MSKTNIPWATDSINPIRTKDGGYHCTKVSEGCERCYAEGINMRFGNHKPFDFASTEFILDEKPFEKLKTAKKPKRVFLQSMGDIAHPDVPENMIRRVWELMRELNRHTFLVLTKRPARLHELLNRWGWNVRDVYDQRPLPNVWIGVTAENQRRADERIPILLQIPAVVHWLSYEPALGPLVVGRVKGNVYRPWLDIPSLQHPVPLDWVVCGCETGPGARPMDESWVRSMKNQCVDSRTAFFLKAMMVNGKKVEMPELDGKVWAEYPKVGVAS